LVRICPNPIPWDKVYRELVNYSKKHDCTPSSPPIPLVLSGWVFSNDVQKMERWQETIEWAQENNCSELVNSIPDDDFYYVEKPNSNIIDPLKW
jgi:hypothetical protein